MRLQAVTILLAFFATGCACSCKVKPEFVFDCGNGRVVTVEYMEQADVMRLGYEGQVYRLPRAISASGARYSDGHLTFWEKGGTAFLEREGKVIERKCVLQVPEKP